MNVTGKLARQHEIQNLVQSRTVRTQIELANLLKEIGYSVSQPTLSKDIAELGLVKVPLPDGGYRYQPRRESGPEHQSRKLNLSLREFLVSCEAAGQIVVLKTVAGHAAGLAWAIDNAGWPEAVGTIAGEDTVLLVAKTPEDAGVVISHIERILEQ